MRGGRARGAGSVGLEGYDWEYFVPLREDIEYRMEGGIVAAKLHDLQSQRARVRRHLHHDAAAVDGERRAVAADAIRAPGSRDADR